MSTQNVVSNTGKFAIINTDTSQIFIGYNRYLNGLINNSTYVDVTYPAGTVMGRVATTNYLKPMTSTAVDGSAFPVGILADDYTVTGGTIQQVSICVQGDVAEETVRLQGTDTLDTIVDLDHDRRIKDMIAAETVGIRLVSGTQMSGFDNA